MPTKIEWAEETWNPVTGCSPISEGCQNCYAKRMANRLRGRCGYPADDPFRVTLHPERLGEPLRWKEPRKVFVCSMGDLFHEFVPTKFIIDCLSIMAEAYQHTFMILTKRPERMRAIMSHETIANDVWLQTSRGVNAEPSPWPLPNVWLGVTAENQKRADERIPILLQILAVVRFVSVEPCLSAVNIVQYLQGYKPQGGIKANDQARNGVSGSVCNRGIFCRSGRQDMETQGICWGQQGGFASAGEDAERATARRNQYIEKAPTSSIQSEQRKDVCLCPPGCVDDCQPGGDTFRDGDQPQGRGSIQQSSEQPGGSDQEREHTSCRQSIEGAWEERATRREKHQCEANSRGCSGYPGSLGQKRSIPVGISQEIPCISGNNQRSMPKENLEAPTIDWVICGGETGPGARPMHPDWVRSLRDQCQAAETSFYFKQWGEWSPTPAKDVPVRGCLDGGRFHSGSNPSVGLAMYRVGKKAAGRILDGRTWDEFPEASQ